MIAQLTKFHENFSAPYHYVFTVVECKFDAIGVIICCLSFCCGNEILHTSLTAYRIPIARHKDGTPRALPLIE